MSETTEVKEFLKWDFKTLVIILCVLTISFFAISFTAQKLPPPYHKRDIPSEITPWLK